MRVALALVPSWSTITAPLGIASVAGALRRAGHDVRVFDLNVRLWRKFRHVDEDFWSLGRSRYWQDEKLFNERVLPTLRTELASQLAEIAAWEPEVLGLSIYDTSYLTGYQAALIMRFLRPQTRIVFGGPGARKSRFEPQGDLGAKVKVQKIFDAVVIGEGEASFLEVLGRFERNLPLAGCAGIAHLDERGEVVFEGERPNIELKQLGPPWFGDLDLKLYAEERLPVMMSRGCIAKCTFCSETRFWRKYRYRDARQVLDEILSHASEFNIRSFAMADSLMNGNFKLIQELVELIIASGEKLRWSGMARLDPRMTREFLDRMALAGVQFLTYGLETGSQAVMDLMEKRTTVENAGRIIKDTHEAGIKVHLNMIVGFPNETEREFEETLDFLRRHIQYISVVNTGQGLSLYPDTPLFEDPEAFGIRANPDGSIYYDEEGNWVSLDGKSTFAARTERLERLKTFLDGFPHIVRSPADTGRQKAVAG